MWILLTALVIAVLLTAYAMFEGRINRRPCLECGFLVSKDAPAQDCPKCGAFIPPFESASGD